MDFSGDRMDIDGPAFNVGRRRNFDEFARGEDIEMARVHQHLDSQVPVSMGRRVNRFAIPEPSAGLPPLANDQRPLSWAQVLAQTLAVGTVVIAILSVSMCLSAVRVATRAGRQTWERREQIRQTCFATVQSKYNVAKRRLVTLSGMVPTPTPLRRRQSPPSSPSPRRHPRSPPSSPGRRRRRSNHGTTSDLSIRDQYLDLQGMRGVDPMDIDSESSFSDSSMDFEYEDELHGKNGDFAHPSLVNIIASELDRVHDADMEDATDSSLQPVTNPSPQASTSTFQTSPRLTSSLPLVATPMGTATVQSKSPPRPVTPDPKPAPKKSVAFFASPKTGRPITGTKKFIAGECMDFPVGSSPASEGSSSLSSLSSIAGSVQPDDTLIHDKQAVQTDRSLEQPDVDSGVDLYRDAEPEFEQPERSQASVPNGDDNVGPSGVETAITALAGNSITEAENPAEVVEVTAVDTAVKGNRPATRSSRGRSRSSRGRTRSSRGGSRSSKGGSRSSKSRSKSPQEGLRRSTRSRRISTDLVPSLESFHISSRRGSVRVVEQVEKGKKALEEQKAAEAAKKRRKEKEAAEAARKANEAEAARRAKEAEEERRKQGTRRTPKEKVIQPLDATWEANVQQALNTPNMREVLVTLSSGTSLTRKDIGTLKVVRGRDPAHGWLNDEIIAACLQQVVDYGLKISNHQAGSTPTYHAFNTFFYKNLRDKGTQSVKRWATKAKIGKEDFFKVERVFIPVHQGAHWTLLVVSPMAHTIEYFDSMGGRAGSYVQNVKLWLAEELGKEWKEDEWKVPTGSNGAGPRQTNGSDCGVFTCTTAKMVVLGVDPMSYGGDDMEVQRSRMVAELLNDGLNGDFEPKVVF